MAGGAGVDTFKLLTQHYRMLLHGPKTIWIVGGSQSVGADPLTIADFQVGKGGGVLDYSDLLKNAAKNFDGSNLFATRHLNLVESGSDTLLEFDLDGSSVTTSGPTTVVIRRM